MTQTHVLFDLDGTLSHSEPGILGKLVEALHANDVPVPPVAVLRTVIGPPFAVGLPAIGVPADRLDRVIDHYRREYTDGGGLFDTTCYEGVGEMLDRLAAAGKVLAVATSKPEDSAAMVVEHLGLTDHFAVVAGADTGAGRTDKASVIARALELLGIEPGPRVVMVGDRVHDIDGARHHGIDTIAVAWGYGTPDEHAAAAPFAVADTPKDVVELLLG